MRSRVISAAAAGFSAAGVDGKVLGKRAARSVHLSPCRAGMCPGWNSSLRSWRMFIGVLCVPGAFPHRSYSGFLAPTNGSGQVGSIDCAHGDKAAFFVQAPVLLLVGKSMSGSQSCSMQEAHGAHHLTSHHTSFPATEVLTAANTKALQAHCY